MKHDERLRSRTSLSNLLDTQALLTRSGLWHGRLPRPAARAIPDCRIELPTEGIDSAGLERVLMSGPASQLAQAAIIRMVIPPGVSLTVDATLRLLCLTHQLEAAGKSLVLEFITEDSPVFQYFDRMGFFVELGDRIQVRPARPLHSAAERFRGNNDQLIEIAPLNLSRPVDVYLPSRMETALLGAMRSVEHREHTAMSAFYLISALVDNVYAHSGSPRPGYAALQVYRQARCARICVSDSGKGLLQTFTDSIPEHYPELTHTGSTELLVQMLRTGQLSRLGKGHGSGLKHCADLAIQLRANLDIRLAGNSLRVIGDHGILSERRAEIHEHPHGIDGTHIVVEFALD